MDKQIAGWRATDTIRIVGWVGWIAIYVLVALQLLTFGGKLNMDPLTLSIALFIAMLVVCYPNMNQRKKVSRHKGGLIVAALLLLLALVGLFAKPFDGDTNFALVKIGIIGCVFVCGLSDVRMRYKEHGRYGSLVWSTLGMALYVLAIICVFERDAFTQLPLILQSNLPTFLEFPYVTLAFLTAGAAATITSRVWESRLQQPE